MMKKKVAIVFFSIGPYHLARLESMKKYSENNQLEILGVELATTQNEYPWQFNFNDSAIPVFSLVTNISLEQSRNKQLIQKLYAFLKEVNPDVLVISGYAHPVMIASLFWSVINRKPAILLSETHEYDAPRSWWLETIKSHIIRLYKAALVGGKPQRRYLIKLGMSREAIFEGHNVVGNETFHPHKIKTLSRPIDKSYFLSINRFIAKKNIPFLLSAYAHYRQLVDEKSWDLVLCGDGYLRTQIQQQIEQLNLNQYIHLPGFLSHQELLPYFAHASCFIHASTQEQWGLVVNEAMAAGLPVLVSNRCGCFEDLVREGINGFGFDPENQAELTNLMVKMSSGEVNLEAMGKASLEHIQNFSPDYFAQGLIQAVEYSLVHSQSHQII